MNNILNKNKLISFFESFKISKSDQVWIHHPITEDLVVADVINVGKTFVILQMPENSPYAGQPQFSFKKTNIVGIK